MDPRATFCHCARWAGRNAAALAGIGIVSGLGLLWIGCSENQVSQPEEPATNVVTATYQPAQQFEESGKIDLNGERKDIEWGSEFTPERPYRQVRVSAENGSGDPGPPHYVSVKAVYTDEHLYMLFQWMDPSPDVLKDVFIYNGPTLSEPVISCAEVGGETVCDSLFRHGLQDSLLTSAWWFRSGDDDKLALTFEMEPAGDERGSFDDLGCLALCHVGREPAFGPMTNGRLDLWYWLAGRTNPIRNIFGRTDDPEDPLQGTPGYLDDWYVDASFGLVPDPGRSCYWENCEPGAAIPTYVYRRVDDPFFEPPEGEICENEFREPCRANNGLPYSYLWRESATAHYETFAAGDTLNETIRPEVRKWRKFDIAPGYLMSYPRGGRADVRGKGGFDEERSCWTLELARALNTGDSESDVIFDTDPAKRYYFTVAIFDASTQQHWGSEPQVLMFGPKDNGRK